MAAGDTPWSQTELESINEQFRDGPIADLLRWVDRQFSPRVSLACSFGGLSGMVLVDLTAELQLPFEIFYLDTDLLFPETYRLVEEVKERYGLQPVPYSTNLSLAEQAAQHGGELWMRDPDLCCSIRKVEPNRQALAGKSAWITGIRRDQTANRNTIGLVEWDDKFHLVKVNPLAGWTEEDVRTYVDEHHVPYNPLLDKGFPSIGCLPCTRAVAPGEDPRAGRWAGLDKTECGLHLPASPTIAASSLTAKR